MVTVSGGLGAWRWGADGAVRWLGRFASLTALALAHSLSLSPASFFSFVSLSVFLPHLIVRVYITIQKSSFSPPRHSNIRLSLLFLSLSLPFVPAHPIFRHWIIVIVIVCKRLLESAPLPRIIPRNVSPSHPSPHSPGRTLNAAIFAP